MGSQALLRRTRRIWRQAHQWTLSSLLPRVFEQTSALSGTNGLIIKAVFRMPHFEREPEIKSNRKGRQIWPLIVLMISIVWRVCSGKRRRNELGRIVGK